MDRKEKRGFTLAELLIVVAIIAVLVAIAIPVFTARLEQSRETTDLANLRSAYAAGQVAAMNGISDKKAAELSGSTYEFDPNDDFGLVEGTAGASIGQGTAVDGKVDTTNVAKVISENWHGNSDVRGKHIQVIFNDKGVSAVKFAD